MKNVHLIDDKIYITSDENTKVCEWTLNMDIKILVKSPHAMYNNAYFKKIILTTDQDLIKDGVQSIDDEFLEWFVKNPSCEEVKIKRNFADEGVKGITYYGKYFLIIPKEEPKQDYSGVHFRHCYQGEYEDGCKYGEDDCPAKPLEPKQLTSLKEAAEMAVMEWNGNIGTEMQDCFIAGAKWQASQQDQFAIKFGVWLSVNCDQDTSKDGWWLYEKTWLTTDECLLKFKNGNT